MSDRRERRDRRRGWEDLSVYERMREWCRGRVWWWRAPIVAALGFVALQYLLDSRDYPVVSVLNTQLHELGHWAWAWADYPLSMWGGVFTQCLAPALAYLYFDRRSDYFFAALSLAWLSTNLIWIAQFTRYGDPSVFPYAYLGLEFQRDECKEFFGSLKDIGASNTLALFVYYAAIVSLGLCLAITVSQVAFMLMLENNRRRSERRRDALMLGAV